MREKEEQKMWEEDGVRGSLTVEALLFLIPFIMAFCTLISAARFVQAEMLIHHAITQTAKQISTYNYVLTKSKISEKMQETQGKSDKFLVTVDEATSSIEGFADAIQDTDALAEGVFSLAKHSAQQAVISQVVGTISEDNIEKALSLMSEEPDEMLEDIGIVGGLSGLDYSKSKMDFKEGGKGEVQIIVTYTMKNNLFPDFDFGQYEFCQCAYTVIW